MDKKNIAISGIITILLLLVAVFIFSHSNPKNEIATTKAIPTNSKLFIQINDLLNLRRKLESKSKIYETVNNIGFFKIINNFFELIKEIEDKDCANLYSNLGKACLSIGLESKNKLTSLLILPNISNSSEVEDEIEELLANQFKLNKYKYEKAIINKLSKKKTELYYSIYKGFLLFSKSNIFIEESIRQLNSHYDIADNAHLKKLINSSSPSSDINLYINHKEFSKLVSVFAHNRYKKQVRNYNSLSTWSEFDIDIKPETIYLSGISDYSDISKNYLSLLKNEDPQTIDITKVLPSTTSMYHVFAFDNFSSYLISYIKYLTSNSQINRFNRRNYLIKKNIDIDLEKFMNSICDNQVANVYCNYGANLIQSNFFVIKLKSQSITHAKLRGIIDKHCDRENLLKKDFIYQYQFDEGLSFPIYKLPFKNLGKTFFGDFYAFNQQNYCSFYDNYMILGANKNAISYFLKMNVLNSTLSNDLEYKSIEKHFSKQSNMHFYLNLKKSLAILRQFLDPKSSKLYERNINQFNKIQAINYQAQSESNISLQNVSINFNSNFSSNETKPTVWETILSGNISQKPKFVLNHNTKEREVIVQDDKNRIYLINKAGRIIWSRQIESSIIGEIQQVDLYKNRKLQFLFNTKDKIYAIDRNGNFVDRFPITLRSEATAPVSVFDYDNSRDYRFVIPTADRRIEMYDSKTKVVNGWKFKKSESKITSQVEHIRINNKDYIIAFDKNRCYILNRKGQQRVHVNQTISKAPKSTFQLVVARKNKDSKLVITDVYGNIIDIYFDGRIKRDQIQLFSRKHIFYLKNFTTAQKLDYIFSDDNILYVYNHKKEKLFEKEFDARIEKIDILRFSSSVVKLGIFTKNNKAYIVNQNGTTENSFPLKASGAFSIGKFINGRKNFNIVMGAENNKLNNYEYELN